MSLIPLRERRQRASRRFLLRVVGLLFLMGALAYSAWLAPWAKAGRSVPVEAVPTR